MERYGGLLSYMGYLFLQYLLLSDRIVLAAMSVGFGATVAGLAMTFRRPPKKYIDILFAVSFLPLCLGIVGTFTTTGHAWNAARIEERENLQSSADKYYNSQYLFSKYSLYSFPCIIGLASSLPPLLISMRLRRRTK